ncbi:hypothetical protein ACS91_26715, partial [Vibrio parahaemolyticus]
MLVNSALCNGLLDLSLNIQSVNDYFVCLLSDDALENGDKLLVVAQPHEMNFASMKNGNSLSDYLSNYGDGYDFPNDGISYFIGSFPDGWVYDRNNAIGKIKKILIICNSGSGKMWLSKQLSRKLQLQEVNLDSIVWEPGGYNQKRSTGAIENEIAS